MPPRFSLTHFALQIALVGCGGFIGSALRFTATTATHRLVPISFFPLGTFLVNVLGCLAIGYLAGLADLRQALSPSGRLFLLVGILGGFTTFSTYAYESLILAQNAQAIKSLINITLQVALGLAAAWLGRYAAGFTQ